MSWPSKLFRWLNDARAARAQCGRPISAQAWELMRLALGPARLGPGDYYSYRLFESDLTLEQKQRFVGWRREPLLDALNDPSWHVLGLDKVVMTALLAEQGLHCTQTRAIFLPGHERHLQHARCLHDEAELQGWLRDPANYPFFGKPVASGFGRGALWALGYCGESDEVLLRDGRVLPVASFSSQWCDPEHLGYLLQQPLEADPRLLAALGPTPTSLRMMVLVDEVEGPLLHRAFWKLPVGRNMNDNFNDGRDGNLAAGIDLTSGRIVRAVNGSGLRLRECSLHPDTGVDLRSVSVPDWPNVQAFTLGAADLFPRLRFQQWDIALTAQGPCAIEVNLFGTGGCELSQVLNRQGLLDDAMARFLARQAARRAGGTGTQLGASTLR